VVKCSEVLQYSDVLLVPFYRCVYGCMFRILLVNSVCFKFLLLRFMHSYCLYALFCIFCFHRANWHFSATLNEGFSFFFFSCKANARV
jgi:hypothetical protein